MVYIILMVYKMTNIENNITASFRSRSVSGQWTHPTSGLLCFQLH